MTKLNPCPDCGREPDLEERGKIFRVACWHCSSTEFITARSANGAVNAWNAATGEGRSESSDKTLRDEFAMAALAGLLANSGGPIQASNTCGWGLVNCSVDEVSSFVFSLADDMIRERNK